MGGASRTVADLSGPDLDAAVARERFGRFPTPASTCWSSSPALWGGLLEEMLREGDVHLETDYLGRTTALYCIWYINSPAKEVIGLSQDRLPGEAVCRCWLAGRG